MPTLRLAVLIVLALLVVACGGGAPPPTAAPPPPTAVSPPATAAAPPSTSAPAAKPAEKPAAASPSAASPAASAASPAAAATAVPAAAAASTPERKFEIQKPGEIQQPKPMQTLAPFVWPTIPPFQVPGEIQKPGEIQQLPPYTWPTIGEFQRPGEIQVPGEIQKPGEIQAVPNVPSTAECAKQATLQPVGVFSGESFKFQFPAATGECQIPAGLILKSSEGLQDMLVMATIKVTPDGGPVTATVYANCMDFSKHGPSQGSKYSVGGIVGPTSSLGKLIAGLPSISSEKITAPGLQAAVWAITNDVSKGSVSRVLKFEQADLDSARLILQTAGVDPASKNLFK